ncbi:MAG: FHA domain-containing protein [Chloroflexota bacterium]|jgi:pSer/pThr/pTyr-binding forkhead associated (FHA) protein
MSACPQCSTDYLHGTLYCAACGAAVHPAAKAHDARRPGKMAGPATRQAMDDRGRLATAPDAVERRPLELRVTFPGSDKSLTIRKAVIQVGRADPADGYFPELDLSPYDGLDLGVSRRHAIIQWAEGGFCLVDQHSSNGTWLENERLVAGYTYPIPPRATVRFGHLLVQLAVAD